MSLFLTDRDSNNYSSYGCLPSLPRTSFAIMASHFALITLVVANVVPSLSMEHPSHIPQIVCINPPTVTAETIAAQAWPQIDENFWHVMRALRSK
jgi:hypothetical protein